jgi:elongation factor Ts
MLDCKKALVEAQGDMDEAIQVLRKKGLAAAAKRADREANDGRIGVYVHHNERIVTLVELNCETDFVARTEEFGQLAHALAMQVAATNPQFLSKEDVPEKVLEQEREIFRSQIEGKKPDHIIDRIIEGRLGKFLEEACLLEQPFIHDSDRKIKDVVTEMAATVGENVVLRRFVRFELGAP